MGAHSIEWPRPVAYHTRSALAAWDDTTWVSTVGIRETLVVAWVGVDGRDRKRGRHVQRGVARCRRCSSHVYAGLRRSGVPGLSRGPFLGHRDVVCPDRFDRDTRPSRRCDLGLAWGRSGLRTIPVGRTRRFDGRCTNYHRARLASIHRLRLGDETEEPDGAQQVRWNGDVVSAVDSTIYVQYIFEVIHIHIGYCYFRIFACGIFLEYLSYENTRSTR